MPMTVTTITNETARAGGGSAEPGHCEHSALVINVATITIYAYDCRNDHPSRGVAVAVTPYEADTRAATA